LPQVLLAHHLKTLKLPTFLREYDKLVLPVGEEDPDHVVSGFPVMVQRKGLAMVWLK
jgi:hypothetical protein